MTISCDLQQLHIPGYQLVTPLGKGTHGQVWKANGPGNTQVAIKLVDLHRNCGHREWNALQAIKRIRHANLTPIIAVWMVDEEGLIINDESQQRTAVEYLEDSVSIRSTLGINRQPRWMAIVMPLGEETLDLRLRRCKLGSGISADELCEHLMDAARAIDYLNRPIHDQGGQQVAIQHCDVKPANIILMGSSAQLCDFGVARVLHDARPSAGLGSPAYTAPECIRTGQPSRTSDQYSLAITYVELRTGSLPFDEETLEAVSEAHLAGKLNLSRLSEGEQNVIRKATSLDPNRRYDSATEMVAAIRRALSQAKETSRVVQTRRHRNRASRLSRVLNRLWTSPAEQTGESRLRQPESKATVSPRSVSPTSVAAETHGGTSGVLEDTKREAELVAGFSRTDRNALESQPAKAEEGVLLFRRAAAQGNAAAQKNLGDCYLRGWGVEQDDQKAVHWYRKAAHKGHASAQNSLGFCFYRGRGVTENRDEAMRWFRAAADKNHASAQNNLALCLRRLSVASR